MDVTVKGSKEIQRALLSIPNEVSHKIQQAANLDAAKPLIEKEKLLAPEGPTGNLVDSIGGIKIPLKRADFIGEVNVGPRLRRPYRGQAGHLNEFGTRKRYLKGRGKYPAGTSRGIMPAKPFVKPAYNQTRELVVSRIQHSTAKRIVSRMKRELGSAFT